MTAKRIKTKLQGFTLIEMMLVIVIIGMILYTGMNYIEQKTQQSRIDRASIQMQQILNAGLSYYVVNGTWPGSLQCLQGLGGIAYFGSGNGAGTAVVPCIGTVAYLPGNIVSPFAGQTYQTANSQGNFYVYTTVTSAVVKGNKGTTSAYGVANLLAGTLPLSYVSDGSVLPPSTSPPSCATTSTSCLVVGSVNVPGQNLNNARAINFAGLYHNEGCVPVPTCPVDSTGNTMTPQVMVVPVSVSGVFDADSQNVYPISSFSGYATGPSLTPDACSVPGENPPGNPPQCADNLNGPAPAAGYWRACLQVITEKGDIIQTTDQDIDNNWGQKVTLMALTRCSVTNEPQGSTFSVFGQ